MPLAGTVLEKKRLARPIRRRRHSSLLDRRSLDRVVQVMVVESEVSAMSSGMPVEITAVGFPGEVFFGTVDFIEPTVNPENRTVKMRVVVDNRDAKLKPGMYVNAAIRSPVGEWGPAGADVSVTSTDSMPSLTHEHATDSATTFTLPTETQEAADQFLASLPAGAEYYMCPMDPQVVSDRGEVDCPICGMHLKKTTSRQSQRWRCSSSPPHSSR
jgi:hypothetical protein